MNNTSVIIKNMTINTRSDGRLEGRITVNGKRKSFYGHTKTEIKNKAKEFLMKVENGYRDPEKILLSDYIEYWLQTYKYNMVEPSTYTRMVSTYKHQLKNTIGKKYIGNVTTKDIQNLINSYANPKNESDLALAKSGLEKILQILKPCFKMAIKENIITVNPCIDVSLPSESYIKKETKEQFSLSDSELEIFKEYALKKWKTKNEYISRDCLVLLVMVNTGLRVGEMLALDWSDIDTDNKIMRISKTIQSNVAEIENFEIVGRDNLLKKSPKTHSGKRVIPLNSSTLWYIEELKQYDNRHHIISKYVATTKNGNRVLARNLHRSLERLVVRANLNENISLHTLRHTFGSTLLRRKVPIEIVSSLMGHANITITYNKYIHVIQEEKAKAMQMTIVC